MLGPTDTLPRAPRRILIAGVSGAGKSTLAIQLASRLGIPYTDIDALYHGPNWTRREEFYADVDAMIGGPAWVTEWQYRSVRPRLAARADILVWLDFPIRVWMPRLVRRRVQRRRGAEVLWAGNVEAPLWHLLTGRDHVLAWTVRTHRDYRTLILELENAAPRLQVVRLRTPREVELWLRRLPAQAAD
ncbi:adenylate kinase family enzyme [Glaciihabitans tibetensis]|uniref:Adenylate kinase family enzyme n=1 Tax=Glaciihabitans tibetensis TaxID=1266600 RepID=A0A2T0VJ58_9MICO|nr:(d)CMP kinase [Glaciihabitans tibetensis]PRY70237.1 adenylate kinase family enzyme [Glaciihabitans tibetensis]